MYIISQDKKKIISLGDNSLLEVTKPAMIIGEKDAKGKKYCITCGNITLGSSFSGICIGLYVTEEEAIAELTNVYEAIQNGEKIYAIR